ncbi:MAG: hypothetical protein WCH43_04355 [Verrucomicrobiota bacterium]
MKQTGSRFLFLVSVIAAFLTVPAQACPLCMGGADTPIAPAMNGAIFLMLGLVAMMLTSAGGFIFYLSRRARGVNRILSSMQEGNKHA